MGSTIQRTLALLILAGWLTPSAGALAITLHVALDHHSVQAAEHAPDWSALAAAAEHGHHHQAATAQAHEHPAIGNGCSPTVQPHPPVATMLASLITGEISLAGRPELRRTPRYGPLIPLFTTHCSLLL